ncbi:MAG: DUF4870 domain-containing protein [Solirubrobacteraceae bacterium]|nr:DUF4870 domain-containing protein [Solirubrobacteraceae bacterium]
MTDPGTPPPPPNWYPDPQNPSAQRWWDGSQWTDYERPAATSGATLPAGPPMNATDERNWVLAAHLSALPASFAFLAFVGPLLVLLIKGGDSPLVRQHAVAALNFHLSWMLWGVILVVAMFVLSIIIIGFLLIPVIIAGAIAWLVIVIMASVQAGNGNMQPYNYPLTINFVK